jgi:hypothetical protein
LLAALTFCRQRKKEKEKYQKKDIEYHIWQIPARPICPDEGQQKSVGRTGNGKVKSPLRNKGFSVVGVSIFYKKIFYFIHISMQVVAL